MLIILLFQDKLYVYLPVCIVKVSNTNKPETSVLTVLPKIQKESRKQYHGNGLNNVIT